MSKPLSMSSVLAAAGVFLGLNFAMNSSSAQPTVRFRRVATYMNSANASSTNEIRVLKVGPIGSADSSGICRELLRRTADSRGNEEWNVIKQRINGRGHHAGRIVRPRHRQHSINTEATEVGRADENDLTRAIDQGEFVVHFQRQIALGTGRVVGFEALVRRQTPQGELVAPVAFIPLAERTGLMVPLGRLILERACEQLAAIHRHLPLGVILPWVAVNFSARQLESPGIVDDIVEVLNKTGLDPDLLWIEITETALMQDLDLCAATLNRIHLLGVHLSIDDFGTGSSSLQQVKLFPIEQLKIDRSFTKGLGVDDVDTSIVVSIISLAHSLGMHVVAEGVETAEQRDRLVALGCDVGQGYFWGKAMPSDEAAICLSGRSDCYGNPVRYVHIRSHEDVATLRPKATNDRLSSSPEVNARLGQLPDRQREVVYRLVQGERVAGIANAMYLSQSTVRNHLSGAFREFGVSGQEALIRLFIPPAEPSRIMELCMVS